MTRNTVWMSILLPKSAKQEKFTEIGLKDIEKHVNYPTHKGMGLVIQVPISGQTTIGGLTTALSFRKSARIFIAAL